MKEKLENLIRESLKKLDIEVKDIVLEHPADLKMGDYSSNIAMVAMRAFAKAVDSHVGTIIWSRPNLNNIKNPKDLAEKIVEELNKNKIREIEKIEAKNGFVNFYLSREFFVENIKKINKEEDDWGKNKKNKGKKILVEHSSPNLFKPFHIGHVMNNTIGESITRLAKFSGADVEICSFPSDISLGIGKAIWVLLKDNGFKSIQKLQSMGSVEVLDYLGDCYVRGTKIYDEDEQSALEIKKITQQLYEKDIHSEVYKVYEEAKRINLAYFIAITEVFGSKFREEDFIYESEAGIEGEKIIKQNIPNIFEKSEGAIVYKGEQDGLHTRVFINREGNPTYEAKDLGLIALKFKKYNPDISIFVTDHEQIEHFKVVMVSAKKINKEWGSWIEKSIHRIHGRMSFKGQKMTSRLGGVPIAQTLLQTIREEVSKKSPDLPKEVGSPVDDIAISALKFSILRAAAGKNINFDPEASLSFEGDSGPYLQYSAVRANSVLEKSEMGVSFLESIYLPEKWEVTELERKLSFFDEIVDKSIKEWAPHHIVSYLISLSQTFNNWYGNTKIIDLSDSSSFKYKLAITRAFYITMKNGLYLLGIKAPERM